MYERPSPTIITAVITELANLLGDRLCADPATLREHSTDASHHVPHPPAAVAYPLSITELAAAVKICAKQRVPVIPFGTGTAVEGGIVAIHGGICFNLRRLNRILEVNTVDRDATVQAGVTRKQLNDHLDSLECDLFFSVDPGANASLGGMAATRASGSTAVGYGTMRENVMGLTAVMADGSIVRTGGRVRKSAAGYDLTRLLVGSEGTLGCIAEVTLELTRRPAAIGTAVAAFPSVDKAVNAVLESLNIGVTPVRVELLDEIQMTAVNYYSDLDYEDLPTLFLEFHGSASQIDAEAHSVARICGSHGGGDFRWSTDESDRQQLWQARHDAYYAALALRPGGIAYVTDVCVPVSQLGECIARTKADLQHTRIPAPLFGHVGDGNFHVVFVIEPGNMAELHEVRGLSRRFVQYALELGGTCTGEHGIGLGKIEDLETEAAEALPVMCAIKRALDPDNIMNPGKVLNLNPGDVS